MNRLQTAIDSFTRTAAAIRRPAPKGVPDKSSVAQKGARPPNKRSGHAAGFDRHDRGKLAKFIAVKACERAKRDDNPAIMTAVHDAARIMIDMHGAFDRPEGAGSIINQEPSDIALIRDDPANCERFINVGVKTLTAFAVSLPINLGEDDCGVTMEAIGLLKAPRTLFGQVALIMTERGGPAGMSCKHWSRAISENLKTIKGARLGGRPEDVFPNGRRARVSAYDIAHDAFRETPFLEMFSVHVPVSISSHVRVEHANITAPSGSGKTQFLQNMLLHDLDDVRAGKASIVLFDTDGELSSKLIRHGMTDPDLAKRLVYINPAKKALRPEINLLDLGEGGSSKELIAYVMAALGEGLTGKMTGFFDWMSIAMSQINGATLDTMIDIITSDEKAGAYMDQLSGDVVDFFHTSFTSGNYAQTREQVADRLLRFRTMGELGQMFRGKSTNLNMRAILDEGAVVVIRIDKLSHEEGGLGGDASLACRFFLASIVMAFRSRRITASSIHWWVYLDEVADMIGGGNDKFLVEGFIQARKKRTGITVAYQFLKQLEGSLREAALGNTSIKVAGKVKKNDREELSTAMECSTALFGEARKADRRYGEMACRIDGVVDQAAICRFPFGRLEALPPMDAAAYRSLMADQERRWAYEDTPAVDDNDVIHLDPGRFKSSSRFL